MVGFTEEIRLVGGDGIDQCCLLLKQSTFIEHIVAIFVEGLVAPQTQPLA
jgi:hypothetical protein